MHIQTLTTPTLSSLPQTFSSHSSNIPTGLLLRTDHQFILAQPAGSHAKLLWTNRPIHYSNRKEGPLTFYCRATDDSWRVKSARVALAVRGLRALSRPHRLLGRFRWRVKQSVVKEKCRQGSLGRHQTVEERQKKQWSRLGCEEEEEAKKGSRTNTRKEADKKKLYLFRGASKIQNTQC